MKYIADLHIHSPYSRATSRVSTPAGLFAWAQAKGIQVLGTGDFTHPVWVARLRKELKPAEPGFFRLKREVGEPALPGLKPAPHPVRFVLSAEISCIYKKEGRVRKIHNLLFVPDFDSAARVTRALERIGNIASDGRPILGLDSRDLLEILLEKAPDGFLVPAHIWTPWFSLLGAKSGFDSVEGCFGDLSDHVFALETGLSSDPAMNRLVSGLDRFTLISNSDCHSPANLGREANRFETEFDYFALRDAIRKPSLGFLGTIEFFPEEGKYHADGHRSCGICIDPRADRKASPICPACGRPLTPGVARRVMELADRGKTRLPKTGPSFDLTVPLAEILAELAGTSPRSKKVLAEYVAVVNRFGSELGALLGAPTDELAAHSDRLAEAVARVRKGNVIRRPGYDGEYGVIRVTKPEEIPSLCARSGSSHRRPKAPLKEKPRYRPPRRHP